MMSHECIEKLDEYAVNHQKKIKELEGYRKSEFKEKQTRERVEKDKKAEEEKIKNQQERENKVHKKVGRVMMLRSEKEPKDQVEDEVVEDPKEIAYTKYIGIAYKDMEAQANNNS